MSQLDPYTPEQRSRFGSLLDIRDEDIIGLALKIRLSAFDHATPEHAPCKVESRHVGSKNIVFVVQMEDFKMVIRVPAKGRVDGWTDEEMNRLESHVEVLDFIQDHVQLPAPVVYHYDQTFQNEIGAPYLCTSFMEGEASGPLTPGWYRFYPWHADPSLDRFDKTNLTPRQEETLRSLASYMVKLSGYSFYTGEGAETRDDSTDPEPLRRLNESPIVESMYWSVTNDKQLKEDETVESGHDTMNLPKEKDLDIKNTLFVRRVPVNREVEMILRKPVVFQDILINETGTVIGILDWEGVLALPRFGEYFNRLPVKDEVIQAWYSELREFQGAED